MHVLALFLSQTLAATTPSLPERPIEPIWTNTGPLAPILSEQLIPLMLAHENQTGEEIRVAWFQAPPMDNPEKLARLLSRWWRIGELGSASGRLFLVDEKNRKIVSVRTPGGRIENHAFEDQAASLRVGRLILKTFQEVNSPVIELESFQQAWSETGLGPRGPPTAGTPSIVTSPWAVVTLALILTALLGFAVYWLSRRDAHYSPRGWVKQPTFLILPKAAPIAGGIDGSW